MLDALRKLIADFTEEGHHPSRFASDDYRLAACALLVHTATIDGAFPMPSGGGCTRWSCSASGSTTRRRMN